VMGATLSNEGDLAISFIDLKGEVQARWSRECFFDDLAVFARQLVDHLVTAIAECGYDAKRVTRVVVGLPALINSLQGEIEWMATLPPGPVPIRKMIEDRTGIPASIENDICGMARGEHWFGRARNLKSFLLVEVDFTIAGAMFLNGLPVLGANGLNPEIGHMKIDMSPDGNACFCGARGCVTSTASITGLLNRAGLLEAIPKPPFGNIRQTFDDLVSRAIKNDPGALDVFRRGAGDLGFALANYINIASPGQIFIVTKNRDFGDLMQKFLKSAIDRYALPGIAHYTRLLYITTDAEWREKGVAATALEQAYLSSELLL
jgi:predicted NBD/HSP70 family sugar kinase